MSTQNVYGSLYAYAAVPGLYKPENKDGSATSFRQELTGNDIK